MRTSEADIVDNQIEKLLRKRQALPGHNNDVTDIAVLLLSIQKKPIPEPRRQNRYLLAEEPVTKQVSGFKLLILSASGLLAILLTVTSVAIATSHPGKRLYSYKKTAQRLQVKLTLNPESKAKKELALAEKRLNEAKELISTHPNNQELTVAALTELAQQTEQVVASIEKVSDISGDLSGNEITQKLGTLAKGQLALLDTIAPSPETDSATQKILSATKQIIAATNEEDPANPDLLPITITGSISAVGLNSITVNETIINTSPETVVEYADTRITAKPTLVISAAVSVTATQNNGSLFAEKIIITTVAVQPKKPETSKQEATPLPPPPSQTTEPPKQYEAKGSFIPEDPTPQPIM